MISTLVRRAPPAAPAVGRFFTRVVGRQSVSRCRFFGGTPPSPVPIAFEAATVAAAVEQPSQQRQLQPGEGQAEPKNPKKLNFFAVGDAEFDAVLTRELGQPRFRAAQVREWVYKKGVERFAEMDNLPRPLREALEERFSFGSLVLASEEVRGWVGGRSVLSVSPEIIPSMQSAGSSPSFVVVASSSSLCGRRLCRRRGRRRRRRAHILVASGRVAFHMRLRRRATASSSKPQLLATR
jgi:hypothetical protein